MIKLLDTKEKFSFTRLCTQPSVKGFPFYKRCAKLRNKSVVMLRYLLRPPEKQAGVIFTSWLIFFSGSPFTLELQFVAVCDKRRLQTCRLEGKQGKHCFELL